MPKTKEEKAAEAAAIAAFQALPSEERESILGRSSESVEVEEESPMEPAPTPSSVSLNGADLMALFAEMNISTRDGLLQAIRELKAPSQEDLERAEERAAQKVRTRAIKLQNIRLMQEEEASRAHQHASCLHGERKTNRTWLKGQVHSNGHAKVFCPVCKWNSEYFKATEYEKSGGLKVDEWGADALAYVKARVAQTDPAAIPTANQVPKGATISFFA